MALAKDQSPSCSFFGNMLAIEPGSSVQFPHISPYDFGDYSQKHDGENGLDNDHNSPISSNCNKMMSNNQMMSQHSPPLSSSSSANSSNNGFGIHQQHEEAHSLINFKSGYGSFNMQSNGGGSLLSFQQNQDQENTNITTYQKISNPNDHHHNHYPIWDGRTITSGQIQPTKNTSPNLRLLEEVSCLQTASSEYQDTGNEWLYAETSIDPPQESATQQTCFNKRPHMEDENMQQALKKQCTTSASKKVAKPKSSTITTKDPQSIAAKNRRERISERLKILQDLVPNGTKVDLVTMLEKAIGYVKFLQLQVKVLATDEFWPAAGGKAPDISQVREAIDAILSSQRTTSSSSK